LFPENAGHAASVVFFVSDSPASLAGSARQSSSDYRMTTKMRNDGFATASIFRQGVRLTDAPLEVRLGRAIRKLRKDRNWSLKHVGQMVESGHANISKIELGNAKEYSLALLGRLASAFGLRVDELFTLAEGSEFSSRESLSEEEAAWLEAYRALPAAERRTILAHLQAICSTLPPPG
jgi:transcriptional regulator with XRE-family HTH domain